MAATRTSAQDPAGHPLPWYYRCVARLLRGFYFSNIQVRGALPVGPPRPRLIVSSHRNGAIDGYLLLQAFPRSQFLVAVQLLRHPLLRLLFTGIPVVRDKDRERYGIQREAHGDPVTAGCAHLRAGGDLVVFPEGSSEWGWRPLPYHRGAARMACALLAEGVPVEVVPVGLHYQQPDRFRSHVELLVDAPVVLPAATPDQSRRAWENQVHEVIGTALDQVSVNCRDANEFARAEQYATAAAREGHSYAETFVFAQQAMREDRPLPAPKKTGGRRPRLWEVCFAACFAVMFAPVLLVGRYAGSKADARNTVTFFRMAGGFAVAWLWLPVLLGLTLWQPLPMALAWAAAALGWWRYPQPN